MHKEGDEVHADEEEASGGRKHQHLRYILAISLLLAIGILSAIWIFGAWSTGG